MYRGKTLLIVTKHAKEQVIAPVFEKELGVKCIVSSEIDTDALGTFSGEIERVDSPLLTAKKKCLLGLDRYDVDLVLSSEGSFGPHPLYVFTTVNEEYLYFMDQSNGVEINVQELSLKTNFNHDIIHSWPEMKIFADNIGFPSHKVLLKKSKNDSTHTVKGIQTWSELEKWTQAFLDTNPSFHVETDMRAFCNPTRMEVIEKAAHKLAKKIQSLCPSCGFPGFDITDVKYGLPCSWCNRPTRMVYSSLSECIKCGHMEENINPEGSTHADPANCDFCNP